MTRAKDNGCTFTWERPMKITQRSFLRSLFVALFGLLMGAAWSTDVRAADKVTYQLGWIPTGEYAPYFAGLQKGFYAEEGIDLSINRGFGSGDTVKKTVGGGATFGEADISALMLARVRENLPVKCVMLEYDLAPHSIFVLESSGIRKITDLAGKRVATSPGNSHQIYFPLLAKLNGLDPTSVTWVNMDPAAWASLLLAGKIDATPVFATHEYWQDKQAVKMGKKIRVIPYAESGFQIYSYCILAREDFIAANPNLVRRFLKATKRSFEWTRANMEEAAKLHVKSNPTTDADDVLGSLRIFLPKYATQPANFGNVDIGRLKRTYSAVAEAQNLDPNVDPAGFLDLRFLPK